MRPQKLDRILAAEASLQPVLAKAHELRTLAGLLDGFLPRDFVRQTRVVDYRDGDMVLLAANPAVAAKLRLLAPSLINFFSKQRLQVRSVSVRVQPKSSHSEDVAPQKIACFSASTLESLSNLYRTMGRSPAREALRVLLERRGVSPEVPRPRIEQGLQPGRKRRT